MTAEDYFAKRNGGKTPSQMESDNEWVGPRWCQVLMNDFAKHKTEDGNIFVSGDEIQLAPMDYYDWRPKEDITAYELARCVPILTAMQTMGGVYNNWKDIIGQLPESCQRHFTKVEA